MIRDRELTYTLEASSPEQVEDLRELWQDSVVDLDESRLVLRVVSNPDAMNQFLLLYELLGYLDATYMTPPNVVIND